MTAPGAVRALWNPRAGGAGTAREALARLHAETGVDLVETSSREDLGARVAESGGFDTLLVGGGDGSVNAALGALYALPEPRPRLAILPTGTGNDTARALGLPLDPLAALHLLLAGRTRPARWDLMRLHTPSGPLLGINSASGGNGSRVLEGTAPEDKARWGALAYLRAAVAVLSDLWVYRGWLAIDGAEPVDVELVSLHFANGPTSSGGLPSAPGAHAADGELDLVAVSPGPLPQLFGAAARHLLGRDEDDPRIRAEKVRRARFGFEPAMDWRVDGEAVEGVEGVEVLPAALAVHAGPGGGEG